MDFLWICIAFVFGFASRQTGLPPLVGYLLAGFGLNAVGVEASSLLEQLADLGITLMLFTIGLKLDPVALLKPGVWGTALVHSSSWVLLLVVLLTPLVAGGLLLSSDLDSTTIALLAFALSFSSTVCVVKMLEDAYELKVRHGRLAIAILIIQDILAVIFLVVSTGKLPSVYAIGLFALIALPWIVSPILNRTGHGELMPLIGLLFAVGGSELFEAVNVKGDLGALIVGILLARHHKASELYKSLISFKDIFLIGFFLSIGFSALPTWEMAPAVIFVILLLIVKFGLFFALLLAFGLSGRSAFLTSLVLSNYSEFGLIVASLGVEKEWLSNDWLVVLAIAMSLSFVISNFLYRHAHRLYANFNQVINRFERVGSHGSFSLPEKIDVLILGMGRVGSGAYQNFQKEHPELEVWGVESDIGRAKQLRQQGFNILTGDADDFEFWQFLNRCSIRLVMMSLPGQSEVMSVVDMMKLAGYRGNLAAVARYEDDRVQLQSIGIDTVFDYYSEVGAGFASESLHLLQQNTSDKPPHKQVG